MVEMRQLNSDQKRKAKFSNSVYELDKKDDEKAESGFIKYMSRIKLENLIAINSPKQTSLLNLNLSPIVEHKSMIVSARDVYCNNLALSSDSED